MTGPLAGVRIIEVGHMLAGPYCGLMLADLGAEVIKIEPAEGDIARRVSPHEIDGHNAYFASLNRSKKSVVLDLATPQGQTDLHRLVASAQALVTNLRPSAIKKLGLTYDALREVNPRIVCAALTGYGLDGTFANRPAYDYVIQAVTGVMAITGGPDTPPTKAGYSAVDNSAGLMAAIGLLAKIIEGKGGQIDVSMHDTMLSQLNYLAGAALNAGEEPARLPASSHPYIVPAQVFPTASGWLVLFISHDDFWRRFCCEIGHDDWITDPRSATMKARRDNRDTVVGMITKALACAPAAEWVRRLDPLGVVVSEIESLGAALASELTAEREMVVSLGESGLRAVGLPMRIDDLRPHYGLPPRLDEHHDALLSQDAR